MKRSTLNLALLVLAIAFAPLRSWAQPTAAPPGQLSYQGFLTDANGIPLATNTPRNFNVVFRIYNSSTGPTPQWAEQQVVTVDRGYFTVMLGSGSSIDSTFTNDLTAIFSGGDASDRYLGITVQGLASPDAEIAPRLRLLASPYAFLAATALNASNALNAVNAANAVNAVNAANVTGANTITASNLSTSIGLWSVAGGDVYRPSGNVGIGTTTPALKLQVNGVVGARDTTSADGYIDLQPGDSAHAGYLEIFKPGPTRLGYLGYSGGGANNFGLNLENSASFNINGGWVGIGTGGANPLAPLEVDGISTSFYVNGPFFYAGAASFGTFGAKTIEYVSIKSQWYVSAYGYIAMSDQRIKDIVGLSNPRNDLQMIEGLHVTDYRMKDRAAAGNNLHKGFIAQEVQKVIPEAVHQGRGFIPDIYAGADRLAFEPAAQTLRVSLAKAHTLKQGAVVRLITEDATIEREVSEVPDETTFVVRSISTEPKRVFVYGKQVDDFLSVDYDRIFTTGISAIQELAKRVEKLEERESRHAEMEQKAGRVEALEREVADLRTMVAQLAGASRGSKQTALATPADAPSAAQASQRRAFTTASASR